MCARRAGKLVVTVGVLSRRTIGRQRVPCRSTAHYEPRPLLRSVGGGWTPYEGVVADRVEDHKVVNTSAPAATNTTSFDTTRPYKIVITTAKSSVTTAAAVR